MSHKFVFFSMQTKQRKITPTLIALTSMIEILNLTFATIKGPLTNQMRLIYAFNQSDGSQI